MSELRSVIYRAGFRHAAQLVVSFLVNLVRLKRLTVRVRKQNAGAAIIGISLLENLGDIVACEPVARHLRKNDSRAFIVWLVGKSYAELVKFNPHIDRVVTLSCITEWIWLSRFRMFDSIVDLHLPKRVCHQCKILLNKASGNREITFDNYLNFGGLLTAFSQSAGLPPLNEAPAVYIPDAIRTNVDQKISAEDFLVFHCEAGEKSRDWPAEKWTELALRIQAGSGVSIVEVGTSAVLAQAGLPNYKNLCGQLSLLETAEVIRKSKLFVGVDSGPAHFANALGVFGIILLGRYHSFDRYLPYSGNYANPLKAELIYADGPAGSIDVNNVFSMVKRNLGTVSALSQVA